MIYLEMSRDEAHGGGTWAFTNCVWAPAEKEGGGRWPFWEKVLAIREGDTILHLRGVGPEAFFVGYSKASADGFETTKRPPDPKGWAFSDKFYRADLEDFTPFHKPISLEEVFAARQSELAKYFDDNKASGSEKRNIFFVRQSGRLQCLNGAYLSDVDDDLLRALFDSNVSKPDAGDLSATVSVETGSQLATIRVRLGQSEFARRIKEQYGHLCCFPSCGVKDPRFLVASHIARWSDNEKLRGHLGNGLCLCLVHDRAFELGLFTLDEHYRVYVNPKERLGPSSVVLDLIKVSGQRITLPRVPPLDDALLEHWIRTDMSP
jgi:putative restriction endonuclease